MSMYVFITFKKSPSVIGHCQFSVQRKHNRLMIMYFLHNNIQKLLGLSPEFLVHCQVNEEVADVVDVVEVQYNLIRQVPVNMQ